MKNREVRFNMQYFYLVYIWVPTVTETKKALKLENSSLYAEVIKFIPYLVFKWFSVNRLFVKIGNGRVGAPFNFQNKEER